jgi:hypothetical protein
MFKYNPKGMHVGRRDFIKTTTMASMAATLPGTALLDQGTGGLLKSKSGGAKKRLLCLTESPATFDKFLESIRNIKEFDFLVNPITVNYQKPQEVIRSIQGKDADILLMCLPRSAFSYGNLSDSMGDLGIPMVLLAQNPDLILIDVNFAAALRANGANASPLPYKLRDYHGMGQGVVPEVEFPVGIEVITGAFSKDLKSFVVWPGRIQVGMKTDAGTDKPASPGGFRRMTCSNYVELKIRDVDRFLQNIAGIHHIMIAGNFSKAMNDALLGMNVSIIGPSDFTAPELDRKPS